MICFVLSFVGAGLAIGETDEYRCIRYCDKEENCSKYCGYDGFKKGGKCVTLAEGVYWCCCYK